MSFTIKKNQIYTENHLSKKIYFLVDLLGEKYVSLFIILSCYKKNWPPDTTAKTYN